MLEEKNDNLMQMELHKSSSESVQQQWRIQKLAAEVIIP
jgi:hypothetical protein